MSSPFTSAITQTLPVKDDESNHVVIRKLAPRHLAAAQAEQQRKAIATFRDLGGKSALAEFADLGADAVVEAAGKAAEKAADPMDGYDRETLIVKGVVSWSYEGKDPADPAVVADLDDDRRDWLAEQILRLAKPRLYRTADEEATAEKNG